VLLQAILPPPGGAGGGGGAGSDVNLIEVGGESIELGEAVMADSIPVVIASDQTPIPVTGSISATNPSVGPTGDPVPDEATLVGFQEPTGDLESFKLESFDYDVNGGNQPQTAIGIAIPASGGPVPVGSANPLPVSQATAANLNATVVGTGTFAVQVSSSALPTGAATLAEQQTQTTALQIIDDWDESDRAKVNPIVGQAGVQGGAGAVSALTQRVVLATDTTVPNVTGNIAADSADSGNPVKVGGVAFSPDGTAPGTAVTEGDRSNLKTDLNGRLFTNPVSPQNVHVHLDGSSAYTDQAFFPDPGDGFQVVMTFLQITTNAATTMSAFLEEGSTKVWGPVALEAVQGRGYVSGPIAIPFTASTAVTLTTSASIAQSIDATYFIQAV
jgi:hypothetical protein